MKTRIFMAAAIMAASFIASCAKSTNDINNNKIRHEKFGLSEIYAPKAIAEGETVYIEFSVNRPSGYKGSYSITFEQRENNGVGTVTYQGSELPAGVIRRLTGDDVILRYTAITRNYHRLDFSVTDENDQKVDFRVTFNEDRQGQDDAMFSASLSDLPPVIRAGESVAITVTLTPGILYDGNYYIRKVQKKGNGAGTLKLGEQPMGDTSNYLVAGNSLGLTYTAITKNYHEFDIILFDDMEREVVLTVIFNEEKKGEDDYAFTATLKKHQATIQENETATFYITLTPGILYSGNYYIKYDQPTHQGFGTLKYGSTRMSERVPYRITGAGTLTLTYQALSRNYHQLDITIYDQEGRSSDLTVIFNENRKGIYDIGFEVTYKPYDPVLGWNQLLEFKLKPIDLDYTGKYYITVSSFSASGYRIYLGKSISGTWMTINQEYTLTLDANNNFYIYLYDIFYDKDPLDLRITVRDNYYNKFEETFKFNQ